MKKLLLLIGLCIFLFSSCFIFKNSTVNSKNTTTFILVRHAEKQKDKDNPSLTMKGKKRAEKLSTMLRSVPIDAIYSSNYNRTLETAAPTAKVHGLEVKIYDPRNLEEASKKMLKNHKGSTILVVGHSNTTPNFINMLAGEEIAAPIDESEYDNLFFVSYFGEYNSELLRLRF